MQVSILIENIIDQETYKSILLKRYSQKLRDIAYSISSAMLGLSMKFMKVIAINVFGERLLV